MTELDSYSPPTTPGLPSSHRLTSLLTPKKPLVRSPRSSVRSLVQSGDRATSGIFLGLMVMTLPAVAYSFIQAWQLCASGSLDHAIRAFAP